MAARRHAGLDAGQIDALRVQLAEGRRPRLKLSATQFPTGTSGTVTRIGSPDIDGPDFITVKVKVNGTMDELAFSPAELSSSVRAAALPEPGEPAVDRPKPRPRKAATRAATGAGTRVGRPPAGSPGRKSGPPPKVSISIASAGATWSASGARGARSIAKNVPIAPGVVTAIAKLLDHSGITDAVAEINETARAEAQLRAELLRAQLTELEAVLATHRSPH